MCLTYPTWFLEVLCEYHGKPLVLEPFQIDYLIDRSLFRIVMKCRQSGGSMQLSMDKFFKAFTNTHLRADIVSTTLSEATDKIKYIRDLYDSLPLKYRIPLEVNNALSIGFHSGSKLSIVRSVAASGTAVRGGRKSLAFDEFAHVAGAEELFFSALPAIMRSDDLGIDIVSTPKGDLNLFAKIWQNEADLFTAKRQWDMFTRHKFIWVDVPSFTNDYQGAQKRWKVDYAENMDYMEKLVEEFASDKLRLIMMQNPWEWFLQEFCGVFLTELDAFFSQELITKCLRGTVAKADDGFEEFTEEVVIPWTLGGGRTKDSAGHQVFMGIDFGESSSTTDKTSLQVLEILPSGKYIHRYSETLNKRDARGADFPAQAAHIASVAKIFQVSKVLCDETGLGRGIVPLIKKMIPDINVEGVNFNPATKEEMVMNLKTLMEQGNLLLQEGDIQLQGQIRNLKRDITPLGTTRYHGEPHDDMFWALCLAARTGMWKPFSIWTLGSRTFGG
jgi:phage FluMu gp28-like protein